MLGVGKVSSQRRGIVTGMGASQLAEWRPGQKPNETLVGTSREEGHDDAGEDGGRGDEPFRMAFGGR